MKTTCAGGCGRLVELGRRGRCRACAIPQPRSVARALRSTKEWTVLSRAVRAAGRCAMCGVTGVPLEADHIIPVHLRPELALDPTNVRPLCRPCHYGRPHQPPPRSSR